MRQNLKGEERITLDELIAPMKNAHAVASGFYCCLGWLTVLFHYNAVPGLAGPEEVVRART